VSKLTGALHISRTFQYSAIEQKGIAISVSLHRFMIIMETSSTAQPIKIGTASTSLNDIPLDIYMNYIVPFIGKYPYCFVAIGIQNFQNAYITVFPQEREYISFATVKDAKIYCDSTVHPFYHQRRLCEKVARKGNLTVLMYLRSVGCPWDEWTCFFAAENGHLDVIQWCRENGCPWDENTCASAAKNGHLDVIQWCHQNKCPWNIWTCAFAAENGHLDVIQWCRENGCPWDRFTCAYAALNGHLDVIQWCHENGCEWDGRTCSYAAANGHLDVIQWSREHGCEWDYETIYIWMY
jgi:hypothetical protein